jgi:hypothetical protein
MPGGIRVFGILPASGLRHQIDATIDCTDAHVIGEWKSYRGPVPKNEVLRFKAATDDLYEALIGCRVRWPIIRLFGVRGDASRELRWYAARHGIALIERSRWPAPVGPRGRRVILANRRRARRHRPEPSRVALSSAPESPPAGARWLGSTQTTAP